MKINKKLVYLLSIAAVAATIILVLTCGKNKSTVRPRTGPLVDAVYALGTVKSDLWYNVRFGMSAIVRKLYIDEGQEVPSGSALVMTDSGLIFRAPFTGTVTQIAYRESEMVPAGQAVLSVHSLRKMYVRVSLDQESIVRIRKGQEAELSFENLRNESVAGRVVSVFPSGSEFLVRISVDTFPPGVLPEMTCDTAIIVSKKENALMVPASSVKNGKLTVFRKGKKQSLEVKTRPVDEEWVEVTEGSLLPEDDILTRGPAPKRGKTSSGGKRVSR